MVRAKDVLGRRGEDAAVDHLERAGLVVLERNWRCRAGEIDIVASEGRDLVVCEVKTRTGVRYGLPVEAVTPVKLERLRGLALAWLADRRPRGVDRIRVDVIGVLVPPVGQLVIDHIRGVEP